MDWKEMKEEQTLQREQNPQNPVDTDEIIADAGFGVWHIILEEGKAPRMQATPRCWSCWASPGST